MIKIKPIKDLRDTNKISIEAHNNDGPIFITKNGYNDLVIMSDEYFNKNFDKPNSKFENKTYKSNSLDFKQSECFGLVKVACVTPNVFLCDPIKNEKEVENKILEIISKKPKIIVFPELTLTGYSCRDIFLQNGLLVEVEKSIAKLCLFSKNIDSLIIVGAPLAHQNSLYNTALAIYKGSILGVVPKSHIPNYNEFYEARQFQKAPDVNTQISINGNYYPFGTKILFRNAAYKDMVVGIEICEDLWVQNPPSTEAAINGATIIANLSASNELVDKAQYRRNLVSMTSARLIANYLYACSGPEESTTDIIFAGHNMIAENGNVLSEAELFSGETIIGEIDIEKIINERRRTRTYQSKECEYQVIDFIMPLEIPELTRKISRNPFVLSENTTTSDRYRLIMKMQAMGLKKRLEASRNEKVVVGLSGGLDSTLALLVSVTAFKIMNRPLKDIIAITLPAFGTSKRTHDNALRLSEELGVTFEEINIKQSVLEHFKDIGLSPEDRTVTYENAQARERTQVLMDYGNKVGALMVGTGDLSELCLGWTTFGGDHMSMYGVNASIPKTLVKELVKQYAEDNKETYSTLMDIIDTPISPELLPPKDGEISQKTEDVVGSYELNDFFIYYFLRSHFSPRKILYLAEYAYNGFYSKEELKKWLINFISRFFANQFKRSCLPDGVKVGTVAVSPRGDLRMPSDASGQALIDSLLE
jgi:NAD+ synthase (glutamine-hydrolysing)